MEGGRVATVGIATFTVSLVAAIWVLLCLIGRLTRQTWLYFVGGALLAMVVIIFVVSPRQPAEVVQSEANVDIRYSSYYSNLGIITAIMIGTAAAALACLGGHEATVSRRAKTIRDEGESSRSGFAEAR